VILLAALPFVALHDRELAAVEDGLHHDPRHSLLILAVDARRFDEFVLELADALGVRLCGQVDRDGVDHGVCVCVRERERVTEKGKGKVEEVEREKNLGWMVAFGGCDLGDILWGT